MNQRAERDIFQRYGVTGFNVRILTADNGIAHDHFMRGNHIPLFAIQIIDQRNPGGSVRIIFNGRNLAWNICLVASEINQSVFFLMTTPDMTAGDTPITIASARSFHGAQETSLRARCRDLCKI